MIEVGDGYILAGRRGDGCRADDDGQPVEHPRRQWRSCRAATGLSVQRRRLAEAVRETVYRKYADDISNRWRSGRGPRSLAIAPMTFAAGDAAVAASLCAVSTRHLEPLEEPMTDYSNLPSRRTDEDRSSIDDLVPDVEHEAGGEPPRPAAAARRAARLRSANRSRRMLRPTGSLIGCSAEWARLDDAISAQQASLRASGARVRSEAGVASDCKRFLHELPANARLRVGRGPSRRSRRHPRAHQGGEDRDREGGAHPGADRRHRRQGEATRRCTGGEGRADHLPASEVVRRCRCCFRCSDNADRVAQSGFAPDEANALLLLALLEPDRLAERLMEIINAHRHLIARTRPASARAAGATDRASLRRRGHDLRDDRGR